MLLGVFTEVMRRSLLFLLVPFLLAAQEPVEIARSKTFTEGPVFDRQGNLYFSHREGLYKLTPAGELIDWVRNEEAGFNGHKILPDGTHLVCASRKSAIWRLDASGKYLGDASSECDGKPLRAPNDITLDAHGGFYFTDPGGSRTEPVGTVHYVEPSGKTSLAAGGMRVPNGLVIDPSAKFLYVSETTPNRVLRFPISAPGKLGQMEVFATLPDRTGHQAVPDGMAIDTAGNLYVAHLGTSHVLVLNPEGKLVKQMPGGNYDVSNLVFGGKDLDQLFITGSVGYRSNTEGRVYRLDLMGVKGKP
jgi:gluconolactonase